MFDNILKELKQNKFTMIVFCIFLGLFLIGWLVFGLVMPKNGEPVYGNRLEGVEEVEVTKEETSDLIAELKNRDYVKNASVHISGKIINVLVTTTDGTSISKAKTLKKIVLNGFEKEQLSFYDVQIFITNENSNAKGYPVIGYKNSTAKDFRF